ncbi:MAG: hypothetical protein GX678_01855, partial [Actinomycetales bacterium]|nr:hypothetical protein [Actinomycetales bacterium]
MDHFANRYVPVNDLRPDELLLAALGVVFVLFALWCLATWIVAQVSLRAALVIAPPLMRAALVAGLVIGVGSTAHADESAVGEISGLALPERPATTQVQPEVPRSADSPDTRTDSNSVSEPSAQETPEPESAARPSAPEASRPESTPLPTSPPETNRSESNHSKSIDPRSSSEALSAAGHEPGATTHRVKPGDTLWGLARSQL